MPRTDFDHLPDDARLWIFGADRSLDPGERERLLERVDAFLETWNAHGHPLTGARRWAEERFLLVGVEATAPPSGCSIDAMVGVLKEVEAELGLGITGHGPVFWRDEDGSVRSASRADFRRLAREGEVDPGTTVFDPTLTRIGDLREEGGFEVPAHASWHGRAFWKESAGTGRDL